MSGIDLEVHEWIENCLKTYEWQSSTSGFRGIECKPLEGSGNHYGSDVCRISAEVVVQDAAVENKFYVYKMMPKTESRRRFCKSTRSFIKEGTVYKEVIPEMENLMKESGMALEYIWPKCFGIRPENEGFLLEDLECEGYKMANRSAGLDYDEASLAVGAIAKYHALAAVLREKGRLDTSIFSPTLTQDMVEVASTFQKKNLKDLITIMNEEWKGEWISYGKLLESMLDSLCQNVIDSFQYEDSDFCTLNHGDLSMANMLFRYNGDGTPIGVRLLDFQLSFYNRPGFDLQYLFQTSLAPDIRGRKDSLFKLYYGVLVEHLKWFGYGRETPTIEEIMSGYRRARLYGLASGLTTLPFLMSDRQVDMESFTKSLNDNQQISMSLYKPATDAMNDSIRHIIRETLVASPSTSL